MDAYLVSESTVVAAPAQRVFDIVADPAMHPQMDGSGSVRASREAVRLGWAKERGSAWT